MNGWSGQARPGQGRSTAVLEVDLDVGDVGNRQWMALIFGTEKDRRGIFPWFGNFAAILDRGTGSERMAGFAKSLDEIWGKRGRGRGFLSPQSIKPGLFHGISWDGGYLEGSILVNELQAYRVVNLAAGSICWHSNDN